MRTGNVQEFTPRCSWFERMLAASNERMRRASMVIATAAQINDLARHALRNGYDPYNSAHVYVPWLKTLKRNRFA